MADLVKPGSSGTESLLQMSRDNGKEKEDLADVKHILKMCSLKAFDGAICVVASQQGLDSSC